jgi:sulfatase maturation enzyme AslB (radical SAM superfamily)
MMIADGIQTDLHVTTNGTQYTSKVERVLGSLRFHLAVSLDGATKKTVESIRVNANYEQQIANLQIFRSYTREKKTDLSLTFCFMRQNWFEFGDYCLFGEELGCRVSVNTVNNPPQSAVNNLPAEELRKILDAMESESAKIEPRLKLNRGVWLNEVERVRTFYRSAESKKDRNTPPELVVIA